MGAVENMGRRHHRIQGVPREKGSGPHAGPEIHQRQLLCIHSTENL